MMMIAVHPHPVFAKFRSLVLGIRPSAAWLAGVDRPGIDLLDRHGRAGWRIGCERLLTELDALDDELTGTDRSAGRALQRWLRYDAQVESSRWESPLLLLEHLADIGLRTVGDTPLIRHDMFLEAWTLNLRCIAATTGSTHWEVPNAVSASVALIIGELADDRCAAELTSLLLNVVGTATAAGGQGAGQLIGPNFRPELSAALRYAETAPGIPGSTMWPSENV